MSKFSINDPVSFINEKQDGIIKAIKTNGLCVVEIEDGFEIDVLESELVLIRKDINLIKPEKVPIVSNEKSVLDFTNNIPELSTGIWLVTCPSESGMVLTGPADYYIINNSSYDILLAASLQTGKKLKGISAAKIKSRSESFLTNLKREEVIDFDGWHIQIIFHNENEFEPHSTVTRELPIKFPDLTSANSKLKTPYGFCKFDSLSVASLLKEEDHESVFANYSAKDLQDAIAGNAGQELKKAKSQVKHSFGQLEVDLHIEELGVNFFGLSNAEIISLQLNHFRKKLDEALVLKSYKIIFIHGVGNGRLKAAIRNELTAHHMKFTDGPYGEYGGGATEVIF